jgi:hypothetical protein
VAVGISALLVVGLDGGDSQAALDSQAAKTDSDIATARFEPVTAPTMSMEARFEQRIPSELFMPPQSVAPPMAATRGATPSPQAAIPAPPRSEVTASVPPAAARVPLPPKRAAAAPKHDPNRKDTATAELARIKATLKLTPSQEPYWPPVEAALRDILMELGYEPDHAHGSKTAHAAPKRPAAVAPTQIDPDRVQRLTSAAMPLLMTFDESQKREVRRLARIMGLENVASYI